jgi:Phosphosulfolactate phosphohydrolase and related enzymes
VLVFLPKAGITKYYFMKVQVISSAQNCKNFDFTSKVVVVIDVLRSTTVITNALNNGARSVIPIESLKAATDLYLNSDKETTLIGGERKSIKVEGFGLGNSPLEYTREVVENKDIILTTSNGTATIAEVASAEEVYIACFRNVYVLSEYIANLQKDIVIVCAGTQGMFSLEDGLCAGLMIHILSGFSFVEMDDMGILLHNYYMIGSSNLLSKIIECSHVKQLISLGFYDDIIYCLEVESSSVIPILRDGKVVIA